MLSSIKDSAKLNEMISVMSLKKLKKKLLIVYHDFLNIFDREKTTQLFLHQSYDHKIELEDESQSCRSWLYLMLSHKLQKIKKYLEKNLKKKFITLSKASFASSILFIKKKDDSLRFYVNYWKLNALIKRHRYSIFLINEVLIQIQDSKYLTWLDIIITFNKLCMSTESENLISFITFFDVYKYRVMLFELINESTFFQHYINNMLFNCLHKFCQIYLNDILIYSKILKKHKTHVKEMLNKLHEVDLQINIDKCKFKIQKISFLELLIFINDLRMNSWKVDVICSWKVLQSLIHVQIFIDFCNFYQRFIKNFLKIAQFMIKLTQKIIHLNEQRSVRQSLRNWSNRWQQFSFWSILIWSEKLFWKWTSWTMSTTKYCLNMMMKKFYIQWSFIARTRFLQNATTRSTTKSFWLYYLMLEALTSQIEMYWYFN